jgi:hypothetical protein
VSQVVIYIVTTVGGVAGAPSLSKLDKRFPVSQEQLIASNLAELGIRGHRGRHASLQLPPSSRYLRHRRWHNAAGAVQYFRQSYTFAGQQGRRHHSVKIVGKYGQLPLSFEANYGQTDEQVKFVSRTIAYSLFLTQACIDSRQCHSHKVLTE